MKIYIRNKQKENIFLDEEGSLVTDSRAVAYKFNNYFVNAAKNLLKDMGEANNQYQDYLKNPSEHYSFLKEIEPIEMLKLLKNLNPKKSGDIYGIPPKLIKIVVPFLVEQLTLIFNASFQKGTFPDKLKVGVIYLIHKSDSKLVCSNYRPILIISLFSKIHEKLMHHRLMD